MSSQPTTGRAPHTIPYWIRVVATTTIVAAALWFLVLPQFSDAESAFAAVAHLSPWPVLAAAVLEAASLLSFTALSRTVLGSHRLPYLTTLRIDLADLAANFSLPGGGATASAVRYRLLRAQGVPARVAVSAATVEVIVANLALFLVFTAGIGLSVAQLGGNRANFVAAAATVLTFVAGFAAFLTVLVRRTDWLVRLASALGRRLPFVGPHRLADLLETIATTLRELGRDQRRVTRVVVFALGNWLLDAAALWMMLAAFGHPLAVGPLLAVYGVGGVLTLLPLTPGGLGLVEGVMVPALVGFGVPHSAALLGVVGWRVFEYWLVIPVGALAYLSLRFARKNSVAVSPNKNFG